MPNRKAPKGFSDYDKRHELSARLSRQIDAYHASVQNDAEGVALSTYDRWKKADDVYHGRKVLSSINYLDDVQPYAVPLLKQRCNALASSIADSMTSASPLGIFKSTAQQDERLEATERTVDYALRTANVDRRLRECATQAVLKGRGIIRMRYVTESTKLIAAMDEQAVRADYASPDPEGNEIWEVEYPAGGPEVSYSGLLLESILPEDFVQYPTFADTIQKCSLVGHRFLQRYSDILAKQEAGVYFTDAQVAIVDDASREGSITVDAEDYGVECYDLLCRFTPEGEKVEKWFRVTIEKTNQELLDMEEFELPTPWYFAPALRYDVNTFFPHSSVGDDMMEVNTIYNDAYTLLMLGSAASAFPTVMATGLAGIATNTKIGIGSIIGMKGSPQFTVIPNRFNGEPLTFLIQQMERVADSVSRVSQLALGQQLRSGATATEAQGLFQGQQAGATDVQANFGLEIARMIEQARFHLANNYDSFKEFHGEACEANEDELRIKAVVEVNGKSPSDTPQAVAQKIQTLFGAAKAMGIPIGQPTKQIDSSELFGIVLNASDLPVSTSKLVVDVPPPAPQPPQGPPMGPGGMNPPMMPPQGPGGPPMNNGEPNPAILAQLLQHAASQGAPGLPPGATGRIPPIPPGGGPQGPMVGPM